MTESKESKNMTEMKDWVKKATEIGSGDYERDAVWTLATDILEAEKLDSSVLRQLARNREFNWLIRSSAVDRLAELEGSKCKRFLESLIVVKQPSPGKWYPGDEKVRDTAYGWLFDAELFGLVNKRLERKAMKDPDEGIRWLASLG